MIVAFMTPHLYLQFNYHPNKLNEKTTFSNQNSE